MNRMDGLIGVIIIVILAIAIYGQIAPATVAPAISSMSNTSAITDYSTWSAQAKSTYSASANNLALANFIVPFIIILAALKAVGAF